MEDLIESTVMTKKSLIICLMSLIAVSSCSEYDDSSLWDKINEHETRISKLEQICSQCNTNISSLQTIINALQENDAVTSVTPIYEGSAIIGYTINFKNSQPATIYNGQNGTDGYTPIIGVKQDSDGNWYWTVDGEWILNDGHKIQANGNTGASGKDGVTPTLKIDNGNWMVSYDGGRHWTGLGKATGEDGDDGDSFFKNVWQDENGVYLLLADNTLITIPSASSTRFDIILDSNNVPILKTGETKTIKYTLANATDNSIVKTVTQNGWTAVVKPISKDSGEILIQAPNPIVNAEILVFASNGEGSTVMAVLDCAKGECTVAKSTYEIDADGGVIDLIITSNLQYSIDIPDEAKDWISEITTKASVVETKSLNIQANTGYSKRFSAIRLVGENENELTSIIIYQEAAPFSGALSVTVPQAGQLESVLSSYDYQQIKNLTINGPLNNDDYDYIKDELVSLRCLDLSKATGVEPNFRNHKYTIDLLILPDTLTEISPYTFSESYIVNIVLPSNLESIGDYAFYNCSRMTGGIIIPSTVTYMGQYAFDGTAIEDFMFDGEASIIKFTDNCLPPTIKSLRIPKSVLTLDTKSFENLTSLTSLSFEKGSPITIIPSLCFAGLPLTEVSLPESLKKIGGDAVASGTKHLKTIHRKNSYCGAFENCTELPSITIPNTVESIEPGAFHGSGIKNIKFESGLKLFTIEGWSNSFGTGFKLGAFSNTQLEHLSIPSSIIEIQDAAFAECKKLKDIEFEDGSNIQIINGMTPNDGCGNYVSGAFCNCSSLQKITIPASVTTIKAGAFYGCTNLVSLFFEQNSNLQKLDGICIKDDFYDRYWGYGAFGQCTSLQNVIIPAAVKEIATAAFMGCTSLSQVIFEDGSQCTTISGNHNISFPEWSVGPFKGTKITSLTLPASLNLITRGAIEGASSLTNIIYEGTNTLEIEGFAFYGCNKLECIDASKGGIILNENACCNYYVYGSTDHYIKPNTITYCPISIIKLGAVRTPACSSKAFGDVSKATLYVPEDAINDYKLAEGWNQFGSIKAL